MSHTKPGSRFQKQFNQVTSDLCNSSDAARKKLDNSDSFSHSACRSSNQMFCQNFCGSFPISLLRIHLRVLWLIFCFVCFLFIVCFFGGVVIVGFGFLVCVGFFFPRADMDAFVCVCVYPHKDFHVIICVVRPTF